MKKPSRKTLIRNLDTICRKLVLERDGNTCITPSPKCTDVMQAGHLFSRAAYSTRWNLKNIHCQCSGHNNLHEYRPEVMTLAFITKFGLDAYKDLYRIHWRPQHWGMVELRKLYEQLSKTV